MAITVLECLGCRTSVPTTAKYCPECGLALGMRPAPPKEPERKYVTLLFSDIRDSTRVVQSLDAEDSTERLRPAIEAMTEAVHRAGGTINRTTGDGILALFGAPQAVEDHALRACRAAILMHAGIGSIDPELELRVGIHTGEIVTQVMRGDFGPVYEVSGTSLHLARRMEQAALPGTTLVSEATWEHVRRGIVATPRGAMALKGFEQPVEAFEITGYVPGSRWAARATASLTQMVGRSDIMIELRERLARAHDGRGQAVMLTGEAGVGKSRLVHELLSAGAAGNWLVWQLESQPLDSQSPFALVRAMLRLWLGDVAGDDGQTALDAALSAKLGTHGLNDARTVTPLRALLDLPITSPEWVDLAQVQRRSRIVAAIGAVVRTVCRSDPLLLIVEDAHWCDRESWQALQSLLPELSDLQMAVIATRRPESPNSLPEHLHCTELLVPELDIVAASRMLEWLLGPDPSLVDVKLSILRAGRIPLYIEEIVDHLVRRDVIEGERGQYKQVRPMNAADLPHSIQTAAASRLDALPTQARSMVLAASVIGRRIDPRLLASVAEQGEAEVVTTVGDLVGAGVFEVSLDPLSSTYEFRHDVLRQAAYDGLTRERRRNLHAKVADGIELLYADRRGEWVSELAYHAEQANQWERGYGYCRDAAEGAVAKAAYDAASAFCDRALAHVARLPSDDANIRRAIDMHLLGRTAVGPKLGAGDWLRHAEQAEQLAESIGDQERQMLASIHRTWAASYMARPLDAISAGRAALAKAEASGRPDTIVVARSTCGQALFAHGDYRGAIDIFGKALELLSGERMVRRLGTTTTTSISCLVGRSNAHALLGAFEAADADAQLAAKVAATTALPLDAAFASYATGFGRLHRLDLAGAETNLREAVDRCREGDYALPFSLFANSLGAALHAQGRTDDAAALLTEAIASAESMSFVMAKVSAELNLGYVALATGHAETAHARALDGLAFSRERGLQFSEVLALRLLAQSLVVVRTPDPAAAINHLEEALALARRMGARPGEAVTRLTLAGLLFKLGHMGRAHDEAMLTARAFEDLAMLPAAARARALASATAAGAPR